MQSCGCEQVKHAVIGMLVHVATTKRSQEPGWLVSVYNFFEITPLEC